jgi:hypothetical protein
VRWYLRFKLSLRDLVEMMASNGVSLAHTTIMRWVQRYDRSSKSAGTDMPLPLAGPGVSTRHTSKSAVCGTTYYVALLISCRGPVGSDSRLQTERPA